MGFIGRLVLFVATAACLCAAPAWAQTNIGQTSDAHNEVSNETSGASSKINVGDPVFRNEAVRTGADSTAKFVFLDSTNLALGPTSRVVLDKFVYEGSSSGDAVAIKLTKGLFRFTTGVLDKKDYKITTTSAAIGVRGTILDIDVKANATEVTLIEGEAIVCALSGSPCVRLKNDGQTARVVRASGTTIATLVQTPVNFASLCAGGGGLCASSSYASVASGAPFGSGGRNDTPSPSGGGGASLCGR